MKQLSGTSFAPYYIHYIFLASVIYLILVINILGLCKLQCLLEDYIGL